MSSTSAARLVSRAGNVTGQAGILEGANPVQYTPSNPIALFIIQAGIVIIFCQLLHYPLRLLNQPRVIAEVIGGIILGPSVMMRIPGFKDAIFPTVSIPVFSNVANLGLIIFLFLVALEVDIRLFTHNWRVAVSVGLAGMLLPFGLGFGIAWGLYHQFHNDAGTVPISFGVYGLFIGTALAITAFPVLCRILSELNLLRSNVGVTVLAAGVGNDVVGWILLALCVALVNNNSGLAALWALLCCIGWVLFLVFLVRPAFMWILKRTGSLHNGPTQGMVALTMLLVLFSAWFTGAIGIHPIFGAFLVGLICPHDGGYAIKLTEKIEDLISVLFLPLYFAQSGLSTDLGLLNDGITWAYVIGVIACAFAGKIIGGTLAARANNLLWRESFTIGCLMSCKGLVELIVLNIGLQAKILSQRTFTIFVVMALVTTVATTPLTKALYPPWYQKKVEKWRRGEIDWDGNAVESSSSTQRESIEGLNASQIRRLIVYLRLDSLPSLFTFITLLSPEGANTKTVTPEDVAGAPPNAEAVIKKRPLEVHGLRILELTDRTSSVMQVTEGEEFYSLRDPVVNAFRAFSQLHDVAVSGRVAVATEDSYAETLMNQASDVSSDFALIPWSEYGSVTEDQSVPFATNSSARFTASAHLDFIYKTLQKATSTCNAGIFIDNGFGGVTKPVDRPQLARTVSAMSLRSHRELASLPVTNKSHHIFFPFFGGVDDRIALRIVLQLAKNPHVTASIVHVNWDSVEGGGEHTKSAEADMDITANDLALLSTLRTALPEDLVGRVVFSEVNVTAGTAVAETLTLAQKTVGQTPKNAGDVIVLGRRHPRLGESAAAVAGSQGSPDLEKTVGGIAEQLVTKGVKASILVIQAGGRGLDM
ncbi:Sodium/hydrogen exchanger family-domain-containing protein [Bombardia bombarda]|uniref:Sodium/hydrogen exchanger family-domain-containing protein n=1 Tax=Bombardia bombarda TaxID=252184 RepID=A0AA40C8F6_9PEZI|nr:Sodium/hydrogen exchanger family-domain-containing protein [Bombardia bombarda]